MRRFLRGIAPYLLYIATAGMVGAWLGTAWVVFTTRDPSYLLGFGMWTFNVTYYVRWSYKVHENGKALAALKEAAAEAQEILEAARYICPFCGAVSYNENDLEHGYCGRCHEYSK